MLDGILGRGFSVKCKSLIKTTRTRIDVVRRRAEAKQRFLKEDLAKLLSNGLDINAYGRTEEFIAGMNLLSCYGFVDKSCEYIVKQLSKMQKQGECPEETREAVASLIYAAARFSDLPELRDLRDAFQQRYGNGFEAFANQKFIEALSSRPPATENRVKVLQDIASEYSIKWDSRGFERRVVTPLAVAQADVQKVDVVKKKPVFLEEKNRTLGCGEAKVWRRDEVNHHIVQDKFSLSRGGSSSKGDDMDRHIVRDEPFLNRGGSSSQGDDDNLLRGRHKLTENKHSYLTETDGTQLKVERSNGSQGDDDSLLRGRHKSTENKHSYFAEPCGTQLKVERSNGSQGDDGNLRHGRHKLTENKHSYLAETGGVQLKLERSNGSQHGKKHSLDNNGHTAGYLKPINGTPNLWEGESADVLFHERVEFAASRVEHHGKTKSVLSSSNSSQDTATRNGWVEGSDRLKSCSSYALPPPYVKSKDNISRPPYTKPVEDKQRHSRGPKHINSDPDEQFIDPGFHNRINVDYSSGRSQNERDHENREEYFVAPAKVKNPVHEKEHDYENERIRLPKPRSIRRKHHKSSSSSKVVDGGETVNRISSSSRRRDLSRKGSQVLFDEEQPHHRKDDDEKIIDKLLIHYSKKPSRYNGEKLRKNLPGLPLPHQFTDGENEVFPHPTRSVSLPHEQAVSPESKRVFTRANTFQPDSQAKHVHPKLPDYDDLAARFAALKGR